MPTVDPTLYVGEWLPDQPQNENPGVNTANNVLPLTEKSYTPFSQFARSASSALPKAPLGALSATDSGGNAAIYTGTANDLFILTSASKPNFASASPVPGTPALTANASGGSLATGTVFVKLTYVNGNGESAPSTEASVAVTGPSGQVVITSPASSTGATGYNVYASTSSGTETKQGGTTAIGTNFTLNSISAGAAQPSGVGPYVVPQNGNWSFAPFSGSMYASNGSDPIQSAPLANGAVKFATVDANAPRAKVIAAIQPGFLLCGNINDVTLGILPAGVRWSSLGSAGNGAWPLVGSNAAIAAQSDGQNIFGDIGQLRAIAPNLATCNAALFFDKAIYRMIYTGDSKIFSIQTVEKLRGTPAPQSVVTVGQISYYLGYDGFYSFDGTIAVPIGYQKVNRFFFTDADPNYLSQVQSATDPTTGLVYWAYSSKGMSGVYNRIIVYNPIIPPLGRFALITAANVSTIVLGLSLGVALDNITSQLGYTLDAVPYSLDSAILAGGNEILGAFDSSFYFGFFTGANSAFQIETTERQFFDGMNARIKGVMPLAEGDTVTAAVGTRQSLTGSSVYGAATAPDRNNVCPQRAETRFMRVMLNGAVGNAVQHVRGARVIQSKAGSR